MEQKPTIERQYGKANNVILVIVIQKQILEKKTLASWHT